MHPDRIPLTTGVASRLLSEQFSEEASDVTELLDTAATTSHVFRLGHRHLARFPLQRGDVEGRRRALLAEQDAMTEFANACPFPSPRLVFIGRPDHGYPMPWSVQTWIPGDVATPQAVASSSPAAHDLARLVLALRSVDVRGRVFEGSGRGGALSDHDDWVAHCLARSASLLPVEPLRALWNTLRITPRIEPDTMCHKDLTPFNILVAGGRVVGVLDSGGFGPADPALDLVVAWHLLDRDRRAEFRRHLDADDLEWRRGAAWALQQALGLVWYYATTNPKMSELGRSTIGRIIDSPELTESVPC